MTAPSTGVDTRVPTELDDGHRVALDRAISNVISTDIAEYTFAQIVDGLPTAEVANDRYGYPLHIDHPIQNHKALRTGVIETIRSFKSDFDSSRIHMKDNVSGHLLTSLI